MLCNTLCPFHGGRLPEAWSRLLWRMVQVSLLSFAFLLKLLLDMSALSRVNIPMYGVLKSATTPFVLLLDYVLRDKRASMRVQLSVYMTALGGFVAGLGDLTFDMAGYILALSSAMATAAYVVIVGKLGEELQLDSFTLLLYNNCWSLPFSFLLVVANGEMGALHRVMHPSDMLFVLYFLASCASAFILNLATYLCTLVNDSLTTSIVGAQPVLRIARHARLLRAENSVVLSIVLLCPSGQSPISMPSFVCEQSTPWSVLESQTDISLPFPWPTGRTKSILQGLGGLFAFGDVLVSPQLSL